MTWDEDDQDKALAWLHVEDDRCPGCGLPLSETTEFEQRADWVGDEVTCHACRVRGAHAEQRDRGPGEFVTVQHRRE